MRTLLCIVVAFFTLSLNAQSGSDYLRNIEHVSVFEILEDYQEELGEGYRFEVLSRKQNILDIPVSRYQLYYQGIPVVDYQVLFQGGDADPDIIVVPEKKKIAIQPTVRRLDSIRALQIAMDRIKAEEYAWENEEYTKIVSQIGAPHTTTPKVKLQYYPNGDGRYKLVYSVDMVALQPAGRHQFYIEVDSGVIMQYYNKTMETTGLCATRYHDNQTVEFDDIGGGNYQLTDATRGNMQTYLFPVNSVDYNAATIPTSSQTDWSNLTGDDQAALDVHWSGMMTYDYLAAQGLNSFDNMNGPIISYVNYGNSAQSSNNAFYNGSVFTYGRGTAGNATFPGPVASVDVAAHEIAHAVTETYGGGLTYYGESGALNEAYSDMLSALVVDYILSISTLPASNDIYTIGELSTPGGIRSMSNPNSQGDPDTYAGMNWAPTTGPDNGGVHTNSSVANYWFYLVTNGDAGTNDNGDVYNIAGGIPYSIMSDILIGTYDLMGPNASYQDFANATLVMANLLDNGSCTYVPTIVEAWLAVGIYNLSQDCVLLVDVLDPETQMCIGQPETYEITPVLYNASLNYEWFLNGISLGTPSNSNMSSGVVVNTLNTQELTVVVSDPATGETNSKSIKVFGTECAIYNYDKVFMPGNRSNWQGPGAVTWTSGRPRVPAGWPNNLGLFEGTIVQNDGNGDRIFHLAKTTTSSGATASLIDKNLVSVANTPAPGSSYQIGASIPNFNRSIYTLFFNSSHINTNFQSLYMMTVKVDANNDILLGADTPVASAVTVPAGYTYNGDGAIKVEDNTTIIPGCNENQYWILNIARNSNNLIVYKFEYTTTNPNGVLTVEHSGLSGWFQYTPTLEIHHLAILV